MESIAGILLLALVIALILAFAKGGMKGISEWLKAKFIGAG